MGIHVYTHDDVFRCVRQATILCCTLDNKGKLYVLVDILAACVLYRGRLLVEEGGSCQCLILISHVCEYSDP